MDRRLACGNGAFLTLFTVGQLPGFAEPAYFDLRAVNSTTSTVSFNFLISNPPGTTTPVSDPATANNSCANTYSIIAGGPLPVTLSYLNAAKQDCDINVLWKVENQVSLKKYEVEASSDNGSFTKLGEVAAKSDPNYAYRFGLTAALKAQVIYIRLKAIDLDGNFRYSKTVTVSGTCATKWLLSVYPNPVSNSSSVTVMAKEGIFDGKYKVSVIGSNGQVVRQTEMTLGAVKTFPLSVSGLSSGSYRIKIDGDGMPASVLHFEKL